MNIWKNLNFSRFFISSTIGNMGDWFDVFALQIIFVHEWRASPILMGLLILLFFLPSIIISPIAGVLADRFSKRQLMIVTDSLSAIITLGLYLSGDISTALLLVTIRSCVVSINVPTQQAYVKHVVSDEHLLKASSYTTISLQLCRAHSHFVGGLIHI